MLQATELEDLRRSGRDRTYVPGQALYLQGDRAGSVSYLVDGHVKVAYRQPGGEEVVLGLRGAGAIVGEMSAIDGAPRPATVTALDEVHAVVVGSAAFRAFLQRHPRVTVELMRTLSRRLRESDRARIQQRSCTTLERVIRRILDLASDATTVAGTPPVEVPVRLSQQELADWVGASRESVNRALRQLRRRGVVRTGRQQITVVDLPGLRTLADV